MNKNRIIKNSIYLYLRMAIMMVISLYSARVLLLNLGVSDFGLFNIVGSAIAFFGALRGLFASSTQRFLNFEIGLNNHQGVKDVFSCSFILHLIVGLLFIICVGFIGYYLINNKLNIDNERLFAANCVFVSSLVMSFISIICIPLDALIIAKEKINVYATLTVIESIMRLVAVLLLPIIPYDRLLSYAVLLLFITIVVKLILLMYCIIFYFDIIKLNLAFNKIYLKQLGSFAGWQFLGNCSFHLSNEGSNIMLNMFFGTRINAAKGIASQVQTAIMTLSNNLMTAANPQIVQNVASGKYDNFRQLISIVNRIIVYIGVVIVIPIYIYIPQLLHLWLGKEIPNFSIDFIRCILVFILFKTFHSIFDSVFKAYGKIKKYQIIDSCILILNLPLSYIALRIYDNPIVVFIVMAVVEFINLFCIIYLAKREINFPVKWYVKEIVWKILTVSFIYGIIIIFMNSIFYEKYNFIVGIIIYILIGFLISCIFGFTSQEKKVIRKQVFRKK